MARKLVVAAIGGNHVDKAAELAKQFGEEFTAKRGWILMTGGKPKQSESKVKDAALFGCKKAHGLMVSILPKKKANRGRYTASQ
jgi:predicted Rossmann-fold nucleotide-binding protein